MSRTKFRRAQAPRRSEGAPALPKQVVRSARPRRTALTVPFLDAAVERFMVYALERDQSPLTVRNYGYSYRNFRAFLLDRTVGDTPPEDRINNVQAWAAWNRD